MRTLRFVLALSLLAPMAGCLVRAGQPGRTVVRERSCPGGYHWDDGDCVHNGNGRGNGHGRGRGHD